MTFTFAQRNLVIHISVYVKNNSITVSDNGILFVQVLYCLQHQPAAKLYYKPEKSDTTLAYSGVSTIKHHNHVFITQRENSVSLLLQKLDAVIPAAMFVFLARHLAEVASVQVVSSCHIKYTP